MFKDNADDQKFEWREEGETAFADYYDRGGVIVLPHVEAPHALRGTGAASRLMQAVADHARQEKLSLMPTCSYAVAWFRRHPDQADVLAKG